MAPEGHRSLFVNFRDSFFYSSVGCLIDSKQLLSSLAYIWAWGLEVRPVSAEAVDTAEGS